MKPVNSSEEPFRLLGYFNPLNQVPAPLTPIGRRGSKLVAVYSSLSEVGVHEEPVDNSQEFVPIPPNQPAQLVTFDPQSRRLLLMPDGSLFTYHVSDQARVFLELLRDIRFSRTHPFFRCDLALHSRNQLAVLCEFSNGMQWLKRRNRDLAKEWYRAERDNADNAGRWLPESSDLTLDQIVAAGRVQLALGQPPAFDASAEITCREIASALRAILHRHVDPLIEWVVEAPDAALPRDKAAAAVAALQALIVVALEGAQRGTIVFVCRPQNVTPVITKPGSSMFIVVEQRFPAIAGIEFIVSDLGSAWSSTTGYPSVIEYFVHSLDPQGSPPGFAGEAAKV